jgi:hypothetical protein
MTRDTPLVRTLIFSFTAVCICLAFYLVLEKAALNKYAYFAGGALYMCAVIVIGRYFCLENKK